MLGSVDVGNVDVGNVDVGGVDIEECRCWEFRFGVLILKSVDVGECGCWRVLMLGEFDVWTCLCGTY